MGLKDSHSNDKVTITTRSAVLAYDLSEATAIYSSLKANVMAKTNLSRLLGRTLTMRIRSYNRTCALHLEQGIGAFTDG